MKHTRTEQREKIMKTLYQVDIYKCASLDKEIDKLVSDSTENEDVFYKTLLNGTISNLEDIDNEIDKYLSKWSVKRIDKTGAAILRMAFFEMNMDTPKRVIINEAINLAKKYSTPEVKNMINACLDKRMKDQDGKLYNS